VFIESNFDGSAKKENKQKSKSDNQNKRKAKREKSMLHKNKTQFFVLSTQRLQKNH
jgi:hypothetical protein